MRWHETKAPFEMDAIFSEEVFPPYHAASVVRVLCVLRGPTLLPSSASEQTAEQAKE